MSDSKTEKINWKCHTKIEKYLEGHEPGKDKPDEVYEKDGNCLLNTGINEMEALIVGAVSGASHIYNNTNATIGVGDSATAASATQTDLQASTNKTYKAMDTSYPTQATQVMTFKATFATGDANYAWNEWVVKHSVSAISLNRHVDSMGTKTSGSWVLTVTITLS